MEKRVAVVEDLDALLQAFDMQISASNATATYAAKDYAERNNPVDRQAYLNAKGQEDTAQYLRSQITQHIRVLLPGEVDRLNNKQSG
jgi:hypothetical protein